MRARLRLRLRVLVDTQPWVEQNSPQMPTVLFVNEHRQVEVDSGKKISDVAADLGIQVCRNHIAGLRFGDWTVWVDGDPGCVSPPTLFERIVKRCKGQRRMANRTRIMGDCRVWTAQGMSSRAGASRPIAEAPNPVDDDDAERFAHADNDVGTSWNVYGHPAVVGKGERLAPKYVPPVKKARPAKAKPAAKEPAAKEPAADKAAAKEPAAKEPAADKAAAKEPAADEPAKEALASSDDSADKGAGEPEDKSAK